MRVCVAAFDARHLSTLSADRRRAYLRLLSDLDPWLDVAAPTYGDAEALRQFLARQLDDGYSPATVRKHLAMAQTFFTWGHRTGHVHPNTLLAVRGVRMPDGSFRRATPRPYRPAELRALQATLDRRWPKLPPDEAGRWLSRFRDSRSPFSRVRSHAIRCQLEAIIALALHMGLRRREIYALDTVTGHADNEGVIVRSGHADPTAGNWREVPFTGHARSAVAAWLDLRYALVPKHNRLWLNVHAAPTARDPMTRPTFDRLLRTYVGQGWTLQRLRDTCGVGWVRAGLPLEHLRQLLGLANIGDVLGFARLVGGSLEGRMAALDEHFDDLVGPVRIADLAG